MARRLVSLLVVLSLGVTLERAARADDGHDDHDDNDVSLPTQAAQAHYDAGRVYFGQGKFRRAIVEFRAAQHDDDRPGFDYNIGVCFDKLGDAARAAAAFQRFLDREINATQRAEVEQRIVELQTHVGMVSIDSRTVGLQLEIDGETVPLPPDHKLHITAGTHHVVATSDGYVARKADLVVTGGGAQQLELSLVLYADAERMKRHRRLVIALGVTGGIVAVGLGVGLGVGIGLSREPHVYDGNVAAIVVKP